MLNLKASVEASILVAAIAASAGVTYVATKANVKVSMSCPQTAASEPAPVRPALPQGAPVPLNQGKTY
jgi:hypothetical protein